MTTSQLAQILVISLTLTICFELPLAYLFRIRSRDNLLLVLLANMLTNPIVVLLYFYFKLNTSVPMDICTLLLEAGAILAEGFLFRKYGREIYCPYRISVILNVFSFVAGKALLAAAVANEIAGDLPFLQ